MKGQRFTVLGLGLAVALASCGTSELTVADYAQQVEAQVTDMQSRFVSIDADWESQTPSLDGALRYWDERLEIRTEFLAAIEALEPPDAILDQHTTALDLFTRMTAVDRDLAALTETYDSISEHRPWLDSPEGAASLALLEEVYAFCRASQAEYDATEERDDLVDLPWIPADMKDVIRVAFGCPAG